MPAPDLIQLFIAPLEASGIGSYMVSGSVAAMQYGEPRMTLDIDIALILPKEDFRGWQSCYPEKEYYLPPAEVLLLEMRRAARGHFNVIHHASGLKADFYPSQSHPLLPWALANRRRTEISGVPVWIAPPEYVILWKLEFHREGGEAKHLRDVRGMLDTSYDTIDRQFLEESVARLGLQDSWKETAERDRSYLAGPTGSSDRRI